MLPERPDSNHRTCPIVVLKIGGSILPSEDALHLAVHEVYRWVREGWKVVVVVSAMKGETDRLITTSKRYGESPDPIALASFLAIGELTSASLLGLALDRGGLASEVLDAASINLRTTGPTLDASAVSIDVAALESALARVPIVVVPGFIGRDEHGRTALLGRGGSDLTALFLSSQLGAQRCRLVKDVDGLYERDPSVRRPESAARPFRYATIAWADAAALGGRILQSKAAEYARDHRVTYEIGALCHREATIVGDVPTRLDKRLLSQQGPLSIVLLGYGVVGGGVAQALLSQPERFRIECIAVRDVSKAIAAGVPRELVTSDPLVAARTKCDVVIEVMGGIEPSLQCIRKALSGGTHVITANKAVIAAHGDELRALAEQNGVALRYSAAVGGAVPMIEAISRIASSRSIKSFEGLLNGTTNCVLDRIAEGDTFEQAVKSAQEAGFAEADPSRDLDGLDAEDKLRLLVHHAFGEGTRLDIERTGLSPESFAAAQQNGSPGAVVRHVVRAAYSAHASGGDRIIASIRPEAIDAAHPLASVQREGNILIVRLRDGMVIVKGKGAGRWPTTQAVVADLYDVLDQPSTPSRDEANSARRKKHLESHALATTGGVA